MLLDVNESMFINIERSSYALLMISNNCSRNNMSCCICLINSCLIFTVDLISTILIPLFAGIKWNSRRLFRIRVRKKKWKNEENRDLRWCFATWEIRPRRPNQALWAPLALKITTSRREFSSYAVHLFHYLILSIKILFCWFQPQSCRMMN